jgi:hypothetical protein
MPVVTVVIGGTRLERDYPERDPIWSLPEEKRERQAVADAQRDLAAGADALSMTPYAIRG